MKFGRLLRATSEGMPQMQTLFSAYKALKKKIKKLPHKEQLGEQGASETLTEEEHQFVLALSQTLNQLNDIYIEKEENSVIRVERLEHELAAATTPEQLNELHKQFVDFHGEVLLLVHWSILAYTATVKILKKHHKRTGLLVKAPQLGNLLSQPFCSTELMTSIAGRVEEDIQRLAERMGVPAQRSSEPTLQQQQPQPHQQGSGTPTFAAAAAAAAGSGNEGPSVAAAAAAAATDGPASTTAAGRRVQDLPEYGLDLQLLHQLAESGSITSRSDTEATAEQDTCASRQQQPQPQQSCSQKAHLQQQNGDAADMAEVQSSPKRRKLASEAIPETGAKAMEAEPADVVATAAAAGPSLSPKRHQQQKEQPGMPAADVTAVPATQVVNLAAGVAAGVTLDELQQQEAPPAQEHQPAAAPLVQPQHIAEAVDASGPDRLLMRVASRRHSSSGDGAMQRPQQQLAPPSVSQQQPVVAEQPEQQSAAATSSVSAGGLAGSCARQASIMRQTQVALTTWRHLQSTASTPSTVMQGDVQRYHAAEAAVTASSAVQ